MREGWELKTIAETTKIVAGGTPKTKIEEYWGGNIAWITPADLGKLNTREVNLTRRTITEEGLQKSSAKLFPAHSVILSSRAPIGHLAINTIPMATNQGCRGIVPNRNLDNVFLFYFLKSNIKLLNELGTGTTFKELSTKALGSVKIPIPPLEEQKQIVTILDKAFTTIDQAKANIEKNIVNAKELFQSKLNAIFSQKGYGWEEKTFQDLSSRIGDGLHGTPEYDENGKYFFINGNNLNNGEIEIKKNTKKVNKSEYLKHKRELNNNTVLVSINGTLGYVAFYNDEPVILGKSACYINFNKEVNKYYIKYLIKSPLFFENMASMSTGATIKNFSLKSMRNYKLHLPPFAIQESVVKELEMLENNIIKLESQYEQKLKNVEDLKKSILQKAFAGELTKTQYTALTPEQKHALLITLSYSRHRNAETHLTFGHTKSEKMIHLFENHAGIDLNRNPIKDAAGPNHFDKVINMIEPLAEEEKYFSVTKEDKRYTYDFAPNSFKGIKKLESQLSPIEKSRVEAIISLFLEENTEQSELYATVYAAWNNLLIKKEAITDEAIVYEARENWHQNKLKIERSKFFDTINKLKATNIIPEGKGKLVEKKTLF